jgi:hypothetical protein
MKVIGFIKTADRRWAMRVKKPSIQARNLSDFVDALQSSGRYTFRREEALSAMDVSEVALLLLLPQFLFHGSPFFLRILAPVGWTEKLKTCSLLIPSTHSHFRWSQTVLRPERRNDAAGSSRSGENSSGFARLGFWADNQAATHEKSGGHPGFDVVAHRLSATLTLFLRIEKAWLCPN